MADSVIGALRVLLGVDTAAFSSGLKDANKSLDSFGAAFASLGKKLAGALSTAAVVAEIKKMINAADELGKASQKFGVPVEQLSALKYAAELADVSFESLGKGLGKLAKAMLESAANPAGEVAKNFKALGISVTDAGGNVKSTETVFTDIAEKFSTMEDGAAKTALAIKIFGRAGAELIPLLNAGRTGIQAMTDEAKKLGIVISAETARKAEEFNDTLKKVHASVDAIALRAAEYMLPALQKLADAMLSGAKQGSALDFILKNLITETDIQQFQYYAQVVENLVRVFAALKAFGSNIWKLGITDALAELDKVIDVNKQKIAELKASWLSLGTAGAFESMENLPALMDRVAKGMTTVNTAVLGTKNALDSFLDSQAKSIAGAEAEAIAVGMGVGAKEKLKVQLEAVQIAMTNGITITEAYRQKIVQLSEQAANAATLLTGKTWQQDMLSPWDLYIQKLKEANEVMARHPELADAAADHSMKAAAAMIQVYGDAAASMMGNFSDLAKTLGKGNKEMFALSKVFAISQAIINVLVGVTKAIAQGGILGIAMGASVFAAGMATVAKIIAEKPPAMALGGSFMVGGAGGVDSKMVPIMATPGEKITVDQNKYGEGSSAGGKVITVMGIKTKEYFSGDVLRDLIDNINSAIGDGYKIKVA